MARIPPSTLRVFLSDATKDIANRRPVTPWTAWQTRLGVPIACGVLVVGCGGESEVEPSDGEGQCTGDDCIEECTDGVDNDGDGNLDCADPDCESVNACLVTTGGTGGIGVAYGMPYTGGSGAIGTGGVEPGGSGGVGGIPYMGGTGGVETGGMGGYHTGGVETGGSAGMGGTLYGIPYTGGTGGADTGGTGAGGTVPLGGQPVYGEPLEDCDNGYDDDGDGHIDCDDPDCAPLCFAADYAIPFETDCANGAADDDTLVDCDDPDCDCQSNGGAAGAGGYPAGGAGGAADTGGYPSDVGGLYAIPF